MPIYAAWDFGGRAGFERLSGLVLLEGAPSPDDPTAIPAQDAYETTGFGPITSRTSLAMVRRSPITALPLIGPDLFVTAQIIAMRVSDRFGAPRAQTPDGDLIANFFKVLFGLHTLPAMTNRAALGFGFDNDYEPLSFARVSIGAAAGPVGRNPNAGIFSAFVGPGEQLLAPTDPHASYDWQPSKEMPVPEPTDIETFARVLFAGPSDFIEWYFPARLTLDVAVTTFLNVQRTGDWRKDVYRMAVTENARVDVPVFAVGGSKGLVPDLSSFAPYHDSIAPILRNGSVRDASPAGFVTLLKDGYVHLDVLTADDSGPGNGEFGPLVEWMDAAAALAPRPSHETNE